MDSRAIVLMACMLMTALIASSAVATVSAISTTQTVDGGEGLTESNGLGTILGAPSAVLSPASQEVSTTSLDSEAMAEINASVPLGTRLSSNNYGIQHGPESPIFPMAGTITVTGRVMYEKIVTDDQRSLPESYRENGKYPPGMNNIQSVFGPPGASSIKVHFSLIDIESGFDHVYVKNEQGSVIWQTDTGYHGEVIYENLEVTVSGHVAQIHMTSDYAYEYWGYNVDMIVPDGDPWRGSKHATVEVWDSDTGPDDLLWTGFSDANGYFAASGISNSDSGGSGGQDIYVKFHPTSDGARVIGENGLEYGFFTSTWNNRPDGSTLDVGSWWSGTLTGNTAWTIYATLIDGWSYLKDGPAGWTAPRARAVWTAGHSAHYNILGSCPSTTHYHNDGDIHLNSPDGQATDVVMHEYAHDVMWHAYGGWSPYTGDFGSHTWTSTETPELAWVEGWADFFLAAAGVGGGFGDAYYGESYTGTFAADCVAFSYEDSTDHYNPDDWVLGGEQWPGEDTNEGAIAFALYDIFDSTSDGLDSCSHGFDAIWDVLISGHQSSFSAFWTTYENQNSWSDIRVHQAKAAIYQGSASTIDYNSNPTVGNGLELLSGSINGWYKDTLSLRIQNTADADWEDPGFFVVSFYYKKVGSPNWALISQGPGWGTHTTNWNTEAAQGDGSYDIKAVVTDGIESAESLYGPISVDNSAPTSVTLTIQNQQNGGSAYTSSTTVNLQISASDSGSGPFQMRFQNLGGSWSSWMTYSTTYYNWVLLSGDGEKRVYLDVRDRPENVGSDSDGDTIVLDTVAPSNPSGYSSSHTVNLPSNDNTVYVSWTGGYDSGSGISGYSFVWDHSSGTVPDGTIETTGSYTTSSSLADGSWYFHVRSVDNALNPGSGAYHVGPFIIDIAAPTNPTDYSSSHQVGVPSDDTTVDVSWSGASDATSGIAGYSIVWDTSSSTVPDGSIETPSTSATSPTLGAGNWYLHVRSVDNAGNPATGAYHIGPFVIVPEVPPTTPGTLHIVTGDERDGVYTLLWGASVDDDLTPLAGYYLMEYPPGGPDWVVLDDDISPSATSFAIPYRAPGIYLYAIIAFDSSDPPSYSSWASRMVTVPWDARLTTDSAASVSPAIAVDSSGNFHIVWSDARDGNNEIYYKKLDANWNVLVADTRLTVDSHDSITPSIAVWPSGDIAVVWSDNRYTTYSIYAKFYFSYQQEWGADSNIAYSAGVDYKEPDVSVDSTGYFICVYRTVAIDSGIMTETIRKIGNSPTEQILYTFVDTYRAGATHDHLECPRIAVGMSTGILHVAFGKGQQYPVESGVSYVLYTRFVSGAWESTQVLGYTVDEPHPCAIDTDPSTGVYVVWDNWNYNSFDVCFRKSGDSGASWGSTIVFGDSSNHQSKPDIAVGASGQVYITWRDSSYGNYEIALVKSTDYGANFGSAVRLTSASAESFNPRICVSASGNIGLVWTDYRNSNWEIYFAAKSL